MITFIPSEMIKAIEQKHSKFLGFLPKLEKLSKKHPNVLVALNVGGGDCEEDGTIAPITEDGEIDESKKRFIREGEPMPQEPFVFVPTK